MGFTPAAAGSQDRGCGTTGDAEMGVMGVILHPTTGTSKLPLTHTPTVHWDPPKSRLGVWAGAWGLSQAAIT